MASAPAVKAPASSETVQEQAPEAEGHEVEPLVAPTAEQPAEQSPQAPQPEFTVSDELYLRTFSEIEAVIAKVSATIAEKDYPGWVAWLSPEYVAHASSQQYLDEVSQGPALVKAGVKLRSLEDYFLQVVVPARIRAKLDRIDFVDATHVKAVTIIEGQSYILYWLVRAEGQDWKIGTW